MIRELKNLEDWWEVSTQKKLLKKKLALTIALNSNNIENIKSKHYSNSTKLDSLNNSFSNLNQGKLLAPLAIKKKPGKLSITSR